jgi:hypothetical protein
MRKIDPEDLSVRQIHHLLLDKRRAVRQSRPELFRIAVSAVLQSYYPFHGGRFLWNFTSRIHVMLMDD